MTSNSTVGVYKSAPGTKVNGIFIPGELTYVKDMDLDIQPYSTALLLKQYGYNIEVNKRIFIDHFDSDIKVGTVLKYTDKYGTDVSLTVRVIPWDDGYMEVMCFGL